MAAHLETDISREPSWRTSQYRNVPMEILVLGLSRTGTSSIRQALLNLGYKNVYHTRTTRTDRPADGNTWATLIEQKYVKNKPISIEEWDQLLGDFDAVTDIPCALFAPELIKAYPNAKVILSVRDSTEAWYKSYDATINYLTQRDYIHMSIVQKVVSLLVPPSPFDRMVQAQAQYTQRGDFKNTGREWYEEHNKLVQVAVPSKRRLLVFNVKQGWDPLCQFLGVAVPRDTGVNGAILPFPRLFEAGEYRRLVDSMESRRQKAIKWAWAMVGAVVSVAVVYVAVSMRSQ